MQELGEEAKENPEKILKPLFISGSGQKRTQGKSLRNLEGMKYFHRAEQKWKEVYDNKKDMRMLYNGWERWITTMGASEVVLCPISYCRDVFSPYLGKILDFVVVHWSFIFVSHVSRLIVEFI